MGTPKIMKEAVSPQESGTNTLSRRDFIAATAATGIVVGVGQSAMASPQVITAHPEYPLPKAEPELFMDTAAGAMLAQLRAAGVRTLFHTNVSGNVPFYEAIEAAADVQVINVRKPRQPSAYSGAPFSPPGTLVSSKCSCWAVREPMPQISKRTVRYRTVSLFEQCDSSGRDLA